MNLQQLQIRKRDKLKQALAKAQETLQEKHLNNGKEIQRQLLKARSILKHVLRYE